MHLTYKSLKSSQKAQERYAEREVKIRLQHNGLYFWFYIITFCKSEKSKASVLVLSDAMFFMQSYSEEQKIEFHFIDNIGDSKSEKEVFDDTEALFINTNVSFDKPKELPGIFDIPI